MYIYIYIHMSSAAGPRGGLPEEPGARAPDGAIIVTV